jgi:hypothetical protein
MTPQVSRRDLFGKAPSPSPVNNGFLVHCLGALLPPSSPQPFHHPIPGLGRPLEPSSVFRSYLALISPVIILTSLTRLLRCTTATSFFDLHCKPLLNSAPAREFYEFVYRCTPGVHLPRTFALFPWFSLWAIHRRFALGRFHGSEARNNLGLFKNPRSPESKFKILQLLD